MPLDPRIPMMVTPYGEIRRANEAAELNKMATMAQMSKQKDFDLKKSVEEELVRRMSGAPATPEGDAVIRAWDALQGQKPQIGFDPNTGAMYSRTPVRLSDMIGGVPSQQAAPMPPVEKGQSLLDMTLGAEPIDESLLMDNAPAAAKNAAAVRTAAPPMPKAPVGRTPKEEALIRAKTIEKSFKEPDQAQREAATFADRMERANGLFSKIEQEKRPFESTTVGNTLASTVPIFGNKMMSEKAQLEQGAGKDFALAVLRKESGATLGDEETRKMNELYLPLYGDKPKTLEEKANRRQSAIENMIREAGTAYVPTAPSSGAGIKFLGFE